MLHMSDEDTQGQLAPATASVLGMQMEKALSQKRVAVLERSGAPSQCLAAEGGAGEGSGQAADRRLEVQPRVALWAELGSPLLRV